MLLYKILIMAVTYFGVERHCTQSALSLNSFINADLNDRNIQMKQEIKKEILKRLITIIVAIVIALLTVLFVTTVGMKIEFDATINNAKASVLFPIALDETPVLILNVYGSASYASNSPRINMKLLVGGKEVSHNLQADDNDAYKDKYCTITSSPIDEGADVGRMRWTNMISEVDLEGFVSDSGDVSVVVHSWLRGQNNNSGCNPPTAGCTTGFTVIGDYYLKESIFTKILQRLKL